MQPRSEPRGRLRFSFRSTGRAAMMERAINQPPPEAIARAQGALMDTLALAGDAGGASGWPEAMRLELQACVTEADRHRWAEKWGRYLNGQAQRDERSAMLRRVEMDRAAMMRPKPM